MYSTCTRREKEVLLDGIHSSQADVLSGVPQGTVLGPLLFLAFINDMPEVTTSDTRLFADDGLLYREINTETYSEELKKYLDALEEWERTWQMHFHPEKCKVIHMCTNKRCHRQYKLHGHTLEAVETLESLSVRFSHGHFMWTTPLPKHLRHLDYSGETCSTAPTESEKGHTMPSSYLFPIMHLQLGNHTY